jgi:hypothetical protein
MLHRSASWGALMLRTALAATSLLIALSITKPVRSQPILLEGSVNCADWIKARTQDRAEYLEHYLLGLLNGLALGSGVDFWRAGGIRVSRQQVFLWMDNYCRSKPLSDPLMGAIDLINERTDNAWDRLKRRPR